MEGSLGVSVLSLVACEVPDDQGLVSATRQEHVGAVFLLVQRIDCTRENRKAIVLLH